MLRLVPHCVGWEPIVVNLGHCYRKQQRWDDAIQVYERALGLCPGQAGTYAALGFTRHLKVLPPLDYTSRLSDVETCPDHTHVTCCVYLHEEPDQGSLDNGLHPHPHHDSHCATVFLAGLPGNARCLVLRGAVVQGDLQQAIEDYHKALGLRPEDTFTAEMLATALQDEAIPEELEGDDVFG